MMQVKKENYDRLAADKDTLSRLNKALAASFLLRSVAKGYEEEAWQILQDFGIGRGELKKYHTDADRAFERYVQQMNEMRLDCGNDFLTDTDKVVEIVEQHAPEVMKAIFKYIN